MKFILIPILFLVSTGNNINTFFEKKINHLSYFSNSMSNNIVTEKRSIESFSGIKITNAIDATITNGNYDGKVSIEAPKDIMDKIITEVSNGILHIKIIGKINLKNSSIKVSFPHNKINSYTISGASKLNVLSKQKVEKINVNLSGASSLKLDVDSNSINLENSGASKVQLSGNVQNLSATISGASKLNATGLKSSIATINTSGASSTTLWALNKLTINSSGASSIKYIEEKDLQINIEKSTGASSIKKITK